jgi:protein gp37
LELIESQLTIPLHRRTPTTYFVNSMSDLFHEDLPDEAIDRVFAVMDVGYWHTYQILTKRGERLAEYVTRLTNERLRVWINRSVDGGDHRPGAYNLVSIAHRTRKEPHRSPGLPLPNVWLGVSCETQKCADERIPHLLRTPAAVRFVSLEPLLGPINLRYALPRTVVETYHGDPWREPGVDWVIVGGESGPGARPCETDWIRDILRQCKDAGVPCFVKQLGADPLLPPATPCRPTWTWRNTILHPPARRTLKLRDRKGGNMEEWPADLRVREMPRGATCANS